MMSPFDPIAIRGGHQQFRDSSKKIRKPKPWKHPEAITRTQLMKMREEFWDTAPHYGGRQVVKLLERLKMVKELT